MKAYSLAEENNEKNENHDDGCVHDFIEKMSILEFRSCEVNQLDDRLKKLNMLKKEAKLLIDNIEHGQHQHYLPS